MTNNVTSNYAVKYSYIEDILYVFSKPVRYVASVRENGDSYMGDDPFMTSLTSALKEIGAGNHGSALLDYLANHENTLIISHVTGEKNDIEYDAYSGEISWNPQNNKGGYSSYIKSDFRPPYIGLAHEMAHAQDKWKGTMDNSVWFVHNGQPISNSEKYAIFIENLIRSEHNVSQRTHYMHTKKSPFGIISPVEDSKVNQCENIYRYIILPYLKF